MEYCYYTDGYYVYYAVDYYVLETIYLLECVAVATIAAIVLTWLSNKMPDDK